MQYISTRNAQNSVSGAAAIAGGLSPDRGLYTPKQVPCITQAELERLCAMDYPERAAYVIAKFLDDYTQDELLDYAQKAYGGNKFDGHPAPVKHVYDNAYFLELWHGPTAAFKDMALQILPYLLTAALKKTDEKRTAVILVATSGDTGKAALEGFADVEGTKISVFYPKDGVSRIQQLQMTTQQGDNVFVSAVQGNFDSVQTKVKDIFTSHDMQKQLDQKGMFFSSANSINWGRAVPQIVYYVSAYCDMVKNGAIKMGDPINVCVPTGNFGNILAAYYAKRMGVNIAKLICASNKNNILTDFLATGEYNKNREFYVTNAPAMDILVSSNLERLLFEMSGQDSDYINQLMAGLDGKGAYTVNAQIKTQLDSQFYGGCCDQSRTLEVIKEMFDKYNYLIDTHTAVGVEVYNKYVAQTGDATKTVIASTASAYKFADSVLAALGLDGTGEGLPRRLNDVTRVKIPAPIIGLESREERFKGECAQEQIEGLILAGLE